MSLTSGFFNSQLTDTGNPDRLYNAEDMSRIFDGIITDGVYMHIGTETSKGIFPFLLSPVSNSRRVTVGVGRAWFDHTWTYLDETDGLLTLPADGQIELPETLPRIDSVVLEVNLTNGVRANSIKIISGRPDSKPEPPALIKDPSVKQYRLHNILLPSKDSLTEAGRRQISPDWIDHVDTGGCPIGTEETPYVTNLLEHLDLTYEKKTALEAYEKWLGNYPFLRVVEK